MLYRVLKVGYLMLGVLSNQFKVPANACWRPRVNSINNKCRLQEGIINEAASSKARDAGLLVVMDKCMRKEHQRLRQNDETNNTV